MIGSKSGDEVFDRDDGLRTLRADSASFDLRLPTRARRLGELLLVVHGPSPLDRFAPRRVVQKLQRHFPHNRMEIWQLPRAAGCFGNVGRNFALNHVRGDYVCWINHDNLVTPQYLIAHLKNIEKRPGCLSVVDIDLWISCRYPRRFAQSQIDLLCFAVPLTIARRVNAFGGESSRVYAADWSTFDNCRRLLPIEYNRQIVGTHF